MKTQLSFTLYTHYSCRLGISNPVKYSFPDYRHEPWGLVSSSVWMGVLLKKSLKLFHFFRMWKIFSRISDKVISNPNEMWPLEERKRLYFVMMWCWWCRGYHNVAYLILRDKKNDSPDNTAEMLLSRNDLYSSCSAYTSLGVLTNVL